MNDENYHENFCSIYLIEQKECCRTRFKFYGIVAISVGLIMLLILAGTNFERFMLFSRLYHFEVELLIKR